MVCMKIFILFLFFILYFPFYTMCMAAFEDMGVGARSLGMGDAFVAHADDAAAVYYNPAGLAGMRGIEIEFAYAQYYQGLTYDGGIGDGFLVYAQPLEADMGSIGFGYLERRVSDLYRENTFIASYGKELRKGLPLCVGISLKYHFKSYKREYNMSNYSQLDPVFQNGASAYGLGIDIGCLYRLGEFSSLGLFMGDINQPDISLSAADRDPVPFSLKMGYSCRLGEKRDYALNIDAAYRDADYKLNMGVENWFQIRTTEVDLAGDYDMTGWGRKDLVGWRAGFSFGTNDYKSLSAGMSYRIGGPDLQFDYAFIYPLASIKNTWGTHRLSTVMRFGGE